MKQRRVSVPHLTRQIARSQKTKTKVLDGHDGCSSSVRLDHDTALAPKRRLGFRESCGASRALRQAVVEVRDSRVPYVLHARNDSTNQIAAKCLSNPESRIPNLKSR